MRDDVDARLTAAFHDVSAPEGLAGRLLDRLAATATQRDSRGQFSAPLAAPRAAAGVAYSRRRALAVGGGVLAVAAAIMVAVWLGQPGQRRLSEQIVLAEAIQSFETGAKDAGRPLSESPAEYPVSRMVRHTGGAKWRFVDGFLGGRGVVYDLSGLAGARARLYVVARGVEGLRTTPALHPSTSAGCSCCASAWQEGGLLYVLVVQGDAATYEGFLNLPRSPMA
jgi:hypothetical protein